MRLHNIPSSKARNKKRKRVGRGVGGGLGKTSGRGQKGQKARTGFGQRPGFESGHVPLYRRLPRFGFNNKDFATVFQAVNVSAFARVPGDAINPQTLADAGVIKKADGLVKILGVGELDRPRVVAAHKFSASAAEKIRQAGGEVVVLVTPAAGSSAADTSSTEASAGENS